MSVAFRRESDEEHKEPRFEIPIPVGPNLVTPAGLEQARSQGVDERFTDAEMDCIEESLDLFGDAAYTPGILAQPVPVADDADRQARLLGRLGRRA